MRGPRDDQLPMLAEAAVGVTGAMGKVAQRLALFTEERGFEMPEPSVATAAAADIVEGEVETTEPVGERLARSYGEAAVELVRASQMMVAAPMGSRATAFVEITEEVGGEEEKTEPANVTDPIPEAVLAAAAIPRWRSLGPTRMDNGQTYGDTRVPVSGRVSAVAIDPSNRNNILCGSAGGGVWQSLNGGTSWMPRTDFAPTLTVGAITFDPANPNTVYVGTGEGNFYWRLGQGVLRSTNGGASFSVLAGAPFIGVGFYALLVDPNDPQHLLAGTTHGLYRSTNGGSNWVRRRTGQTWALSLARPGNSLEVLASCQDGLQTSTDGNTWTSITLPGAPASFNRLAVAHAPSNPAEAFVFGASSGTAYLWRRNPNGTWSQLTLPANVSTNQAWYDWFLAVSPDRSTQIYLGEIEVWRGDRSGTRWTWTRISNKTGDDIHPDQHAIAFDPANANIIYVGCDGGLYRSNDRGQNWQSLNDGLAITEIEYIAQDPGSARWLIGGTQDNGSIRYNGLSVWDHVADGDGGDCTVNRINPDTVFHSYYGMGMERSITKGNFGSFSWVGPNVPQGYGALFYPPQESNGNTIAQAGQSVFISRNNGTNWTERVLPSNVVASAMYIPTPDVVFVGTTNGSLFRIDWSGSNWNNPQSLTSPRVGAWLSDIFADPTNPQRLWVTSTRSGGGRVFRSDNGGANWSDQSAGLPDLPINAVEVDPWNSNRVWVAADLGVYESHNGGASWSVFGLGLPNVLVADLLFHPHARLLRAGTRNRGVWQIPVDGELTQPICGRQWTGTIAANSSQRWFTFNWPATWHVIWTIMPTTVRRGAPQLTWNVEVERADAEHVTYWIMVQNLTNQPTTFEGRYCILSRY